MHANITEPLKFSRRKEDVEAKKKKKQINRKLQIWLYVFLCPESVSKDVCHINWSHKKHYFTQTLSLTAVHT